MECVRFTKQNRLYRYAFLDRSVCNKFMRYSLHQSTSSGTRRETTQCRYRYNLTIISAALCSRSRAGDTILAQSQGSDTRTHRGFVHEVALDHVRVGFHSSFDGSAIYTVRFQFNRTPIRRQHQAVLVQSTSSQRLLFPNPGDEGIELPIMPTQNPIDLFNPVIASNPAQLQVVKSVLNLKSNTAPFSIYGP